MTLTRWQPSHALYAPFLALLLVIPTGLRGNVPYRSPVTKEQSPMQEKNDDEIVAALRSQNRDEATEAVQEVMKRGERMIPLLLRCKGDDHPFLGDGLGHPRAAQLISSPSDNENLDKGCVVTIEVTALYLISALYHGRLSFAQSPYLTDVRLPVEKRRALNKPKLIERAWVSVKNWSKVVSSEGLESVRSKGSDPLTGSGVVFW
jgi:hypothetical protein